MASKTQSLKLAGQSVPFDGAPRLEEIEAYALALRTVPEGATLLDQMTQVVKLVTVAAINARLRPAVPFVMEGHVAVDKATVAGVTTIIEAIRGTIDDPKLKAALGILTPAPNGSR